MEYTNRRSFLKKASVLAGLAPFGCTIFSCIDKEVSENARVLSGVREFLQNIANEDGSFRPGIDPNYKGNSDTGLSGIAAPAYAVIISKTFGWDLPYHNETIQFFHSCQKPDGAFYAPTGTMDNNSPLAKLYNTVQSVVSLRILGVQPKYDPMPVIKSFFEESNFKELPLYTTSFFSLFFSAWNEKMPKHIDRLMQEYIISKQTDDGYLQDHVAATYHAAHYFRLIGKPTPKADKMINRVLSDQKDDGSWHLFPPDWDVHACFDALFILRQLADPSDPKVINAFQKATEWILLCKKSDGGFSHFPEQDAPSDMDAVYFHVGGLVQSGFLKINTSIKNKEILGWGHAMDPDVLYSCVE